ncbi:MULTISPECIES: hypothetical protein [unclassified Rhizobium]|jgi:hypothetical protein|uniref:hypothetical protein n=1 Tax=unclassified Rhizobium TaxID=2613769 RepID=UPI001A9A2030|nr:MULTISPECIES: hypothetical protein [unclassified Rhizobium]MBX5193639.1 hypothetical protein [Rhizobium sp. NZLR3b]MBX5204176.1 hypothetical protein [Rhizobium sp. NZLR1]MBX5212288.1 hypothetical protein [Rhizobium sp. NZLR11]QSZ25255.1 hypothetical protein J3O30_32200 [Rhizobium sp. NZLR1]
MMDNMLQQVASNVMAMGPAVLVQGLQFRRPIDVVRAPALSVDDKRTILAAWASDYYAVDSKPALRHLPGTPEPISIDEVHAGLRELDRRYDL